MTQTKIEISIGGLSFKGEADADWLERQLEKLLEFAKSANVAGTKENAPNTRADISSDLGTNVATDEPLGTFLKRQNEETEAHRFLATAAWLQKQGKSLLKTRDVTDALLENKQDKLSNASRCLSVNIRHGYCAKNGKSFYVTPAGFRKVGVDVG